MADRSGARWIIWVGDDDRAVTFAAPVRPELSAWLYGVLDPQLTALADDVYLDAHAALPFGAFRGSYAVTDDAVHWVVEHGGGLLVTRFGGDGSVAGASFTVDPTWLDADDVPLSYQLVFDAWDSQVDERWRQHHGFAPHVATGERFDRIMQHAQALQRVAMTRREPEDDAGGDWFRHCLDRLGDWAAAHEVVLDAEGAVRT